MGHVDDRTCGEMRASQLFPEEGNVAVRMYCHGLGDCFLVAFATEQVCKPYYVLIDCGVILGTSNPEAQMMAVAEDIAVATGGDIHLLVVTHQHWDHVSGFLQARNIFEQRLRVHHLWLAWTEDPDDQLAARLRERFDREHVALGQAVERHSEQLGPVAAVLDFFGASDSGTTRGKNSSAALNAARAFAKSPAAYRNPGDGPLVLPTAAGLAPAPSARVFVLGPPRDEQQLRRVNPTGRGGETYIAVPDPTAHTITPWGSFLVATRGNENLTHDTLDTWKRCTPFDERLEIKWEVAQQDKFFRDQYGFESEGGVILQNGSQQAPSWRRIESDWLATAGEIALLLDNYTNNTSMVLAIELLPSRKVLLFVADAQVGNWLSWDNLSWKVEDESGREQCIKASNLLARTVLYKVGHHGSHNATLRAFQQQPRGLELMNRPDLVAMVPANREMAEKRRWMKMPSDSLLRELSKKTSGRVIRADKPLPAWDPDKIEEGEWKDFVKNLTKARLYVQYTLTNK